MGVAMVAIGFYHLVGGLASVPGTGELTGVGRATEDSRERFYNAIFIGYALAWIWVAREATIPLTAVNWLAGIFLVGGIGRLLSILTAGWPHWFPNPLSALELVLPPIFFWLTGRERRRRGDVTSAQPPGSTGT
ncbi:DUF4345 domain-containing protein [Aeromicrobium camelliae]|uniref:DUF4345 domain-containing protein n=2 Tax=Aeromicrobium camelliae TaxID=1538144 RepID=A0A3N6W5J2_9ACTN|nr:DUF4345 domain-containing protein [Aeromicrobium camelliae]